MSSLNDSLKKITIIEVLIVIMALVGVLLLFEVINYPLSTDWLYVQFTYNGTFYTGFASKNYLIK